MHALSCSSAEKPSPWWTRSCPFTSSFSSLRASVWVLLMHLPFLRPRSKCPKYLLMSALLVFTIVTPLTFCNSNNPKDECRLAEPWKIAPVQTLEPSSFLVPYEQGHRHWRVPLTSRSSTATLHRGQRTGTFLRGGVNPEYRATWIFCPFDHERTGPI